MLRRARPGLGTLIDIALHASGAGSHAALEAAFARVSALESCLSAHRPDSELRRACAVAHRAPQAISPDLQTVLSAALGLHAASRGVFDVVLPGGGASSADIVLQGDAGMRLRRPLRIDLGGIAKGYVIDRVVDLLRERGIESGCVNAGGDLRVFGNVTEPVALRFADGFRVVAQVSDGAFAASRPGARPMSAGATRGAHFDGRDGRELRGSDTVAVFAGTAMIADALTKLALVGPPFMEEVFARYSAQWRRYPFHLEVGLRDSAHAA